MHSYAVAIISLCVAAASVGGAKIAPVWVLTLLCLGVAVVGVPHGGLDHLTGRKLLFPIVGNKWWLFFFPAYLAVSLLVVAGWFYIPSVTVITFFLISAWHFGLEDDHTPSTSMIFKHASAVAVGGLVIWLPVLCQQQQFESILGSIFPADMRVSAGWIVAISEVIAMGLISIAAIAVGRDLWLKNNGRAFRNLMFAALFAAADVLLSFGIYFCAWHSVRGLQRIAVEHGKTVLQTYAAATPLSLGAIGLAGLGMAAWSLGQPLSEGVYRTLFIGLSAIAVPHLLLHGPISTVASGALATRSGSFTVEATTCA